MNTKEFKTPLLPQDNDYFTYAKDLMKLRTQELSEWPEPECEICGSKDSSWCDEAQKCLCDKHVEYERNRADLWGH